MLRQGMLRSTTLSVRASPNYLTNMTKQQFLLWAIVPFIVCSVPRSEAMAQTSAPQWIDPVILKKLQDIEAIDRSKYKFDVKELAERVSTVMTDVTVVSSTSNAAIPELKTADQPVIVATGKTRNPVELGGIIYPAGLDSQVVYDAHGTVIAAQIARPVRTGPSKQFTLP
jgi:hypothetical protein